MHTKWSTNSIFRIDSAVIAVSDLLHIQLLFPDSSLQLVRMPIIYEIWCYVFQSPKSTTELPEWLLEAIDDLLTISMEKEPLLCLWTILVVMKDGANCLCNGGCHCQREKMGRSKLKTMLLFVTVTWQQASKFCTRSQGFWCFSE